MDLGFGKSNQVMGQAAAGAILKSTQAREEAIDAELRKYDDLLNSGEETLEDLRNRRLAQMKKAKKQKEAWREAGHGTYDNLAEGQAGAGEDVAKAFFDAAKNSDRLVVHFHRRTTRLCDVFHAHLEELARRHPETRFVKVDVEPAEGGQAGGGGAPGVSYLVEKMGIVVMPTLLIVKDRKASHQMRGFDELGGTEDFTTDALAYVLGLHGAITCTEEEGEMPEELKQSSGVNSIRLAR